MNLPGAPREGGDGRGEGSKGAGIPMGCGEGPDAGIRLSRVEPGQTAPTAPNGRETVAQLLAEALAAVRGATPARVIRQGLLQALVALEEVAP